MGWTGTFLVVAILVLLAVAYTAGQMWNPAARKRRARYHEQDPTRPSDR